MPVDILTDNNYQAIKQAPRAVIVVSKSNCAACKTYEPVIYSIANDMPYIKFAKVVLDFGSLTQFKKEHSAEMPYWQGLPLTLLMKNGREISKIDGLKLYPELYRILVDKLIIGSQVYVPGENNGNVTPAIIKNIVNSFPFSYYLLDIGNKIVEMPKEKIQWDP